MIELRCAAHEAILTLGEPADAVTIADGHALCLLHFHDWMRYRTNPVYADRALGLAQFVRFLDAGAPETGLTISRPTR